MQILYDEDGDKHGFFTTFDGEITRETLENYVKNLLSQIHIIIDNDPSEVLVTTRDQIHWWPRNKDCTKSALYRFMDVCQDAHSVCQENLLHEYGYINKIGYIFKKPLTGKHEGQIAAIFRQIFEEQRSIEGVFAEIRAIVNFVMTLYLNICPTEELGGLVKDQMLRQIIKKTCVDRDCEESCVLEMKALFEGLELHFSNERITLRHWDFETFATIIRGWKSTQALLDGVSSAVVGFEPVFASKLRIEILVEIGEEEKALNLARLMGFDEIVFTMLLSAKKYDQAYEDFVKGRDQFRGAVKNLVKLAQRMKKDWTHFKPFVHICSLLEEHGEVYKSVYPHFAKFATLKFRQPLPDELKVACDRTLNCVNESDCLQPDDFYSIIQNHEVHKGHVPLLSIYALAIGCKRWRLKENVNQVLKDESAASDVVFRVSLLKRDLESQKIVWSNLVSLKKPDLDQVKLSLEKFPKRLEDKMDLMDEVLSLEEPEAEPNLTMNIFRVKIVIGLLQQALKCKVGRNRVPTIDHVLKKLNKASAHHKAVCAEVIQYLAKNASKIYDMKFVNVVKQMVVQFPKLMDDFVALLMDLLTADKPAIDLAQVMDVALEHCDKVLDKLLSYFKKNLTGTKGSKFQQVSQLFDQLLDFLKSHPVETQIAKVQDLIVCAIPNDPTKFVGILASMTCPCRPDVKRMVQVVKDMLNQENWDNAVVQAVDTLVPYMDQYPDDQRQEFSRGWKRSSRHFSATQLSASTSSNVSFWKRNLSRKT